MTEPGTAVSLGQLGQIAMTVGELAPAVAFYRDKLGMKLLYQFPNLAFFDCAGIRLMLSPGEKQGENFSSVLYFRVDNLHEAYVGLKAKGVEFVEGPKLVAKMEDHDLWMAFFRDVDENVLALMCEVRE